MNLLQHEKEGFVYQCDAPYMLSFYIKKVFELGEKASELGLCAKHHAQQTHNRQNNLQSLLNIYNSICADNQAQAPAN